MAVGTVLALYERAGAYACASAYGRPPFEGEEKTQKFQDEVLPEWKRNTDEQVATWNENTSEWWRSVAVTRKNIDVVFAMFGGSGDLAVLLNETVQKLFQDMIIGSWTAIEVMIGEVHEAARKGRQKLTADAKLENWRILSILDGKTGASSGAPSEFKDPNTSSLKGARQAYATAFCVDTSDIDESMCDLAMDALYLLRNQFVHQGGIVNRSFTKYSKAIPSLDAYRNVDAPIVLDPLATRRFIENALKAAVKLLVSVDTWLKNHQPPP